MDSFDLTVEALCWLRFGKKMPYVATEAGGWNADVLAATDKFVVEVEVKVSKTDLKRDFTSKRSKHFLYANADGQPSRHVPNYFYFMVPKDIDDVALEVLEKEAPKAGLLSFDPSSRELDGRKTTVIRRPTKLHNREPTPAFLKVLLNRMGSELCGRYVVQQTFMFQVMAQLRQAGSEVGQKVEKAFGTLDVDPEAK